MCYPSSTVKFDKFASFLSPTYLDYKELSAPIYEFGLFAGLAIERATAATKVCVKSGSLVNEAT